MKLLSLLKNAKVIALDTAPFIYFIEENPTYINIVEPLFQEISRGRQTPGGSEAISGGFGSYSRKRGRPPQHGQGLPGARQAGESETTLTRMFADRFEGCLEHHPEDAMVLTNYAGLMTQKGEFQKAEIFFKKASKIWMKCGILERIVSPCEPMIIMEYNG